MTCACHLLSRITRNPSIAGCFRLFEGKDCDEANHKELFSQEYAISSGGCLHQPEGCDEVYYFPPAYGICSVYTDSGRARIEQLQDELLICYSRHRYRWTAVPSDNHTSKWKVKTIGRRDIECDGDRHGIIFGEQPGYDIRQHSACMIRQARFNGWDSWFYFASDG